jgi:serine/threonine protein kinase
MVLEYLPGESLADRLDQRANAARRGVQIALDLASALAFAHQQRIVHRDVKPANVLHAGEQRWKLADFGIARLPDSDLTQVGIFMGTPGYAPPEAISEGRYTAQADVFAGARCSTSSCPAASRTRGRTPAPPTGTSSRPPPSHRASTTSRSRSPCRRS